MKKNNSGQAMLEALFVVVFTTIVMFAFLQICITVVNDMIANEAAFVAMRSAAVTMKSKRENEAKERIESYMLLFYPFSLGTRGKNVPAKYSSLIFSDTKTVKEYYSARSNDNSGENDEESVSTSEQGTGDSKSITVYSNARGNRTKIYDYSGNLIQANTTKLYYFTQVMFGSLVAKFTSNAKGSSNNDRTTLLIDRSLGIGGNRRYQSARNRMVPSPDPNYYEKAYPGARKFKNYDLSEVYNKIFGE